MNRKGAQLQKPSPANFQPVCAFQNIALEGGLYRWRTYKRYWATPTPFFNRTRTIRLNAGRYAWRDCLTGSAGPTYSQTSQLHELATGGAPAKLSNSLLASDGQGRYNFGSTLLRIGD